MSWSRAASWAWSLAALFVSGIAEGVDAATLAPASAVAATTTGTVTATAPPTTAATANATDRGPGAVADAAEPRTALHALVRQAVERSGQVGAAQLVADAAVDEIAQARAAREVQAKAGGGIGPWAVRVPGQVVTDRAPLRWHASLNAGKLLYDGGHVDRLTEWRLHLADSARHAHLAAREQLTLATVALVLDRSRLRAQAVVYGQALRRAEALPGERVGGDGAHGAADAAGARRPSAAALPDERAAARHWRQRLLTAQAQVQSQARLVELRLRRLAGDGLPPVDGGIALLLTVPALADALRDAEHASELAVFDAQAGALGRYAQAAAAAARPQVRLSFDGDRADALPPAADPGGRARTGSYALGLSVQLPLHAPAAAPALAAAQQRARAAELLRLDALQERLARVAEVHEQTLAAFDRARRVASLLRVDEAARRGTRPVVDGSGGGSGSGSGSGNGSGYGNGVGDDGSGDADALTAEAERLALRLAHIDALHDGQAGNAALRSMGRGLYEWLR